MNKTEERLIKYAESVGWDYNRVYVYIRKLSEYESHDLEFVYPKDRTQYYIDKYKPKEDRLKTDIIKLTEEQLEQLKNLNDSKVNEILGITTLEEGKWYKGTFIGNEWLLIYNDGKNASGFWNGVYRENLFSFPKDGRLATKEEVKEALIKEAKLRGFKSVGDLSLIFVNGFVFYERSNTLYLDGVLVFEEGKWAEIIDDKDEIKDEIKQIEQRLKELRDKL